MKNQLFDTVEDSVGKTGKGPAMGGGGIEQLKGHEGRWARERVSVDGGELGVSRFGEPRSVFKQAGNVSRSQASGQHMLDEITSRKKMTG